MEAVLWNKRDVVVTHASRTAIGKFCGVYKDTSAVDLATGLVKGSLGAQGLTQDIGRVVFGMARQAGAGPNPARQVQVFSGISEDRCAWTINMACGSGMLALVQAAEAVHSGSCTVALAGGMEQMTRVPFILPGMRLGYRLGHSKVVDNMYEDGFHCRLADQLMGATAETLAEEGRISRDEQDAYALESQRRSDQALKSGFWKEEITALTLPGKKGPTVVDQDEHPRPDTTSGELAKLAPVFREGGTVTAGNSSGITDGAAILLVMSRDEAHRRNLKPLARVAGYAMAGVDPRRMGLGPVPATQALLKTASLESRQVDLIELNEAFAAQVLACERQLQFGASRLNVNGGSIALGHPIGCTGARICVTLLHEMQRRQAARGLATLCISGGQGLSMLFERASS